MITKNKSKVNKNLTRICPSCKSTITHTLKHNRDRADKMERICQKCAMKILNADNKGENNPFYGMHHTPESIRKAIENRDYSVYKTKEFRKKQQILNSGKNNKMYGKSVYSVWLNKYGKEEADKRELSRKDKLSVASSGKNNSMYGKPSPNGSGQGWKGWYNNHFFRSLRELSYMIYLNENNIKWETGETKKFTVNYIDYKGTPRTTRPDFFINKNELIEIKPLKLHNSPQVKAKKLAFEEFCKLNNYTYKLLDVNINSFGIKKEMDAGNIKFMKNYKQKFLKYIKNN